MPRIERLSIAEVSQVDADVAPQPGSATEINLKCFKRFRIKTTPGTRKSAPSIVDNIRGWKVDLLNYNHYEIVVTGSILSVEDFHQRTQRLYSHFMEQILTDNNKRRSSDKSCHIMISSSKSVSIPAFNFQRYIDKTGKFVLDFAFHATDPEKSCEEQLKLALKEFLGRDPKDTEKCIVPETFPPRLTNVDISEPRRSSPGLGARGRGPKKVFFEPAEYKVTEDFWSPNKLGCRLAQFPANYYDIQILNSGRYPVQQVWRGDHVVVHFVDPVIPGKDQNVQNEQAMHDFLSLKANPCPLFQLITSNSKTHEPIKYAFAVRREEGQVEVIHWTFALWPEKSNLVELCAIYIEKFLKKFWSHNNECELYDTSPDPKTNPNRKVKGAQQRSKRRGNPDPTPASKPITSRPKDVLISCNLTYRAPVAPPDDGEVALVNPYNIPEDWGLGVTRRAHIEVKITVHGKIPRDELEDAVYQLYQHLDHINIRKIDAGRNYTNCQLMILGSEKITFNDEVLIPMAMRQRSPKTNVLEIDFVLSQSEERSNEPGGNGSCVQRMNAALETTLSQLSPDNVRCYQPQEILFSFESRVLPSLDDTDFTSSVVLGCRLKSFRGNEEKRTPGGWGLLDVYKKHHNVVHLVGDQPEMTGARTYAPASALFEFLRDSTTGCSLVQTHGEGYQSTAIHLLQVEGITSGRPHFHLSFALHDPTSAALEMNSVQRNACLAIVNDGVKRFFGKYYDAEKHMCKLYQE